MSYIADREKRIINSIAGKNKQARTILYWINNRCHFAVLEYVKECMSAKELVSIYKEKKSYPEVVKIVRKMHRNHAYG